MAEGSDISIDIVLKEQVKPALDALSAGIAEFTRTLSILTAQAKSAGESVGKVGEKAEKTAASTSTATRELGSMTGALSAEARAATSAASATASVGTAAAATGTQTRTATREVQALISSYANFKTAVANAQVTLQNKVRGLRSAKEAFADLRGGINDSVQSLLSFKNLAIAAVATLGLFKAKAFIEGVVKDAARLDETLRRAAAAVGSLNEATTEKLREDLKRLAIEEGANIGQLAEAAVGVIPDVGEEVLADFLRVSQRFSEVAGGNVGQIADTLIFAIKGFGIESDNASESIADVASSISDKLFVAAREGNIAIGQLTGIIGLAAQQAEVLGISFDELLAAFTALGDVGVKPIRAFRVLSGVLNGIQEPSFKVQEGIARINKVIPGLNLDFSRTGLAADGLARFLGKLTVALKADDQLAKELGLNTRELGLIFKATANEGEALSKALEQIRGSRGEVDRAAEFILEGTEGKLRRIQAVFASLKDDIAQLFIPAIDRFLGDFQSSISQFRNAVGGTISAVRETAARVVISPDIDSASKQQFISQLQSLQDRVNKAGVSVVVEALIVAFRTGGEILVDLLLLGFTKAGIILKDIILDVLPGVASPGAEARNARQAANFASRVASDIPGSQRIVPSVLLDTAQQGELLAAVTQLLNEVRLFDRSVLKDNPVQREISARLQNLSRFNPGVPLGTLASRDAAQFREIVSETIMNASPLRAGIGISSIPNDTSQGLVNALLRLEKVLEASAIQPRNGFKTDEPTPGVLAIVDGLRQVIANNIPSQQLDAARTLLQEQGFLGQNLDTVERSALESERAASEANAGEVLAVGELLDSIEQRFKTLVAVAGSLVKAGSEAQITDALATAGDEVQKYTALAGAYSELIAARDQSLESLNEIAAKAGLVVERTADGLISVRTANEAAADVATEVGLLSTASADAIALLGAESSKAGAITERTGDAIAQTTLDLVKRFAAVEQERRKAIGTGEDLTFANELAQAVAKAESLTKQIDLLAASEKSLGDEAISRANRLRDELDEQVQVVIKLLPDSDGLLAEVAAAKAEVDDLRSRASQAIDFLTNAQFDESQSVAFAKSVVEPLLEALKRTEPRFQRAFANLIEQGSAAASASESQKAIRDFIGKRTQEAEKVLIQTAKEAGRLQSEALREIQKDEASAKIIDAIIGDLDRLVTERDEAFNQNLLDQADELTTEIEETVDRLVQSIAGDKADMLRGAFTEIIATLEEAQQATGTGAANLLERAGNRLGELLQSLIGIRQELTAKLAESELKALEAERQFQRRRNEVGQTQAISEPVVGRLQLGDFGAQYAAKQIQAVNQAISELEGSLQKVRALPITDPAQEGDRQLEIQRIESLIQKYKELLDAKLQEQGVISNGDNLASVQQEIAQKERLIALEIDRVSVLETVRQVNKDLDTAQRSYANSQELAASAGTEQYAAMKAVYGEAIFNLNSSKGSTDQLRQATEQYIQRLQDLKLQLQDTLAANPDLAGDITPVLDDITRQVEDATLKLQGLSKNAGETFKQGFIQGLGAAADYEEFVANLGRGMGQAIQSNLGSAIDSVIDGTKSLGEAFQDFVSQTLIDIGKLIIKMLILQAIQSALGVPLFNQGGVVASPTELNQGGIVPEPFQPRRWSGYNTGGLVDSDEKRPDTKGIMGRIRAAVAKIKPEAPKPRPVFVRAFASGGLVSADPIAKAISTIVDVLTPREPEYRRFYADGGLVDHEPVKAPRMERVIRRITEVFDGDQIQALNSGGEVQESGIGKALKAIADVLNPPAEQEVLALAGGGVAYMSVGGFPANPPRRKGRVPGPDVDRDMVPAMLTPGEFVMKRSAVSNYGLGVMYAMNEGIVPKDMFGKLPGIRRLATGGPASAVDIPPRIEVAAPMQPAAQAPQAQSQSPVPAYIVANEQAMQNLLNGGKNSMIDFMRRNKNP